ncbi:hypothetical protein CVV43_00580 [Candidatus Saccharibacteria bacterium HGW-Saccharibacteria-1]|jgi:hypothetical protein|nr:MAG: hypothetical protein CVV43_00580 [Candidatus Saccharibacteria bacterium HGW-Saccharibacteria-1]
MNPEQTNNYDKPVAYDANGQPLYSHPPVQQAQNQTNGNQPQTVHVVKSTSPEKPVINDEVKLKHDRSKQMYPELNLSDGEYVISAVRRHPIGLFAPISIGVLLISFAFSLLFNFDLVVQAFQLNTEKFTVSLIAIPVILFVLLVIIGTYIFYYIYTNNKFFLTNESVIQEIQSGLFTRLEQTVSLSNIEDASFTKAGIAQQIFDYGDIRLSTEGDETTYRFSYVANPKEHIAILNNAVEAFQNGRPVEN